MTENIPLHQNIFFLHLNTPPKACKQIFFRFICFLRLSSCSGKTVIQTHTPVPLRAHWGPLAIFGRLRLTSDTSPTNGMSCRLSNHGEPHTALVTQYPVRPSSSNNKHFLLLHCKTIQCSDYLFINLPDADLLMRTHKSNHTSSRVSNILFCHMYSSEVLKIKRTNIITKCYFRSNISYTYITKLYQRKG